MNKERAKLLEKALLSFYSPIKRVLMSLLSLVVAPKMMIFEEAKEGEWIQPIRRGYLMECCDCGLVHKLDFRLIKYGGGDNRNKIQFRAKREDKL